VIWSDELACGVSTTTMSTSTDSECLRSSSSHDSNRLVSKRLGGIIVPPDVDGHATTSWTLEALPKFTTATTGAGKEFFERIPPLVL